MNTPKRIAVLGSGSWGTALAMLMARNGHQVILWGRNPEKILKMKAAGCNCFFLPENPFPETLALSSDLAEVLDHAEDLLVVVPSHAFRETIDRIKLHQPGLNRMAWATKGIENKTRDLLDQVVAEEFGRDIEMAVISGPTFAKEVAEGLPTAVVVASVTLMFYKQQDNALLLQRINSLKAENAVLREQVLQYKTAGNNTLPRVLTQPAAVVPAPANSDKASDS